LWLDDERAIDSLIDLLDDSDSFVCFLALITLNRIEFERGFYSKKELPRSPEDYRQRRNDPTFRTLMVKHLQAHNAAMKNRF
jgi:HEAT repeat protein